MTEAEEQFMAANGMSSEQAWQYILRWKDEGKIDQVRRGCEEILKSFPDHEEARNIYESTTDASGSTPTVQGFEGQQTAMSIDSPPPTGLMGKIRATVNQQRQKFKEMNPPHKLKPGSPATQGVVTPVSAVTESERLLGAACYLWIFVIIPMLLKRDSEFVQFHAWQGVVITAGVIILNIIMMVLTSPFRIVSDGGGGFFLLLDFLVRILVIVIYIWGAYSAYKGKWLKVPGIYPLAEKLHHAVKS